jgi:hypothetical protein
MRGTAALCSPGDGAGGRLRSKRQVRWVLPSAGGASECERRCPDVRASAWLQSLFVGWWQLIAGLGAVPRALVWDGEGAIIRLLPPDRTAWGAGVISALPAEDVDDAYGADADHVREAGASLGMLPGTRFTA